MSIPRTFTSRNFNRKPARLTLTIAGSTVTAAALVAVGAASASPGRPGAPVAFGTALTAQAKTTAHGSTGHASTGHASTGHASTGHASTALPIAGITLDEESAARAGVGGPAAAHLAGGLSVVTASGRAILASGRAAAHAARGSGQRSPGARPVHHAQLDGSARRVHAAAAHKARHTGPCASSTLHWWICSAEHALEQHGVSRARLSTSAAYIVVQHESGANPHAFNGWDSNAAAGHPSEGIAQVIGPTFHAYALPGHRDIWNPVDNMIAAFRYAIGRYGSMNNIPGVVAVRQGGSYMGY